MPKHKSWPGPLWPLLVAVNLTGHLAGQYSIPLGVPVGVSRTTGMEASKLKAEDAPWLWVAPSNRPAWIEWKGKKAELTCVWKAPLSEQVPLFATAIACGHWTPASSTFQCECVLVTLHPGSFKAFSLRLARHPWWLLFCSFQILEPSC